MLKLSSTSSSFWIRALQLGAYLAAVLAFCGCATVKPELSREERVYNEQLKAQGEAQCASSLDDYNTAQKVLIYAAWPVQMVLYALGQGRVSFTP